VNTHNPATPDDNKAFVLKAFDTLFNQRDYAAAETFWSPHYLQHSAHIEPGRDGLFNLVKSAPPDFRYESRLAIAEDDHVLIHGRFTNHRQPRPWIVVDIVRLQSGQLAEHWDVIHDEASRASSQSGLPMFGDQFPD
jgi:predicted SnoaL-like aldol condensation-catalyzing enzyme